jgi:type VI secretion system (T6SS) effector TldE1-like protein
MSSSNSACYDFAATPRDFSRKAVVPYGFLGSAAVACLVAGCAWTVYTNVFAAGVYPSASNFDVAVIKRAPVPVRTALAASNTSFVVETPPVISAPAVVAQGPSFSFADRFAAAAPQSVAAAPQEVAAAPQAVAPERQVAALAPVTPPAAERKVADAVPMPASRPAHKGAGASVRDMAQRAKAAVMSVASNDKPEAPAKPPTIFERLFGKFESTVSNSGSALAYASADASSTSSLGPASQNIASLGTGALYDRQTAVYDISAHMVYLPDGTKLEAHSGLGSSLDDPRSANIRMRGVTPPHLYDLKPREALFHGVAALRLNPVGGEGAIYGRSGLLAHTFMLGPNGDSNGCVSFRDYNAFLEAYRNKGVRRLAVVAHL